MSESDLIAKPIENDRWRNTGRTHFKPGNRANPGGRPKGLMQYVRAKTKDGKELADIALKIARGTLIIVETYFDKDGNEHTAERTPSHKDRLSAVEFLADRGFGKALATLELTGKNGLPIAVEHSSADDLRLELIRRGALNANGKLIQQNGHDS